MAADTLYRSHDFAFFDAHHWVDWVELCCIANPDGETDVASMADRLREERDVRKKTDLTENEDFEGLSAQAQWATESDKHTLRVKEWFQALAKRAELLSINYPFEINSANTKLQLRASLTDNHRLYVALLMMSNLHYFGQVEADLTSSFETLGVTVFSWLLPAHAQVHRFGKGRGNNGRYQGHIWDKLQLLAKDLSCLTKCAKTEFAPNDTGEAGLDLVGWVPWEDKAPGRFLLFGQCACTPKWAAKQNEASASTWNSKLELVTNPLTVVLIPFFLRTTSGDWHRRTDFAGHLIIDRLRLLHTLAASATQLSKLPAFKHVESCLAEKESAY